MIAAVRGNIHGGEHAKAYTTDRERTTMTQLIEWRKLWLGGF